MDDVDAAFEAINRADFLPEDAVDMADLDAPVPIGFGQTNSQPSTVRMMLDWLDTKPGQRVLDVGSGSGWTTALLSHIVGPEGTVYAVELIPDLVEFGQDNIERAGISNAEMHYAGPELGFEDEAPYDRILVSASADHVPTELIDQLVIGGKIVIPVHETVLEITKTGEDTYDSVAHPGFRFVPLL